MKTPHPPHDFGSFRALDLEEFLLAAVATPTAKVGAALSQMDQFGWMHVTFLMGLYQAARLRQCETVH